ncbi:MAG: DUF3667 domain-containing protein [Pseudomonadota bacterium]|nr:DUF3667 domain-containing protein [Pseudomonadota bacterium]
MSLAGGLPPASATVPGPASDRCRNCSAPLAGPYCHDCGQSVHDPIREVGHAIEELFESLWHLDGRVFRTLRDLPVPGRVACDYLAGHRARYIAPLRLFVILSVLTFFVGQMTVDFSNVEVAADAGDSIAASSSVAELEQRRDDALANLARSRREAAGLPAIDEPLRLAEIRVREQAAARKAELQAIPGGADASPGSAAGGPTLRIFDDQPWHAQDNPVALRWLPSSANQWLNQKIARAMANAPRLERDEDLRRQVLLGSVPTALFVLMPVFALLLKIGYLGSRRLYLEHLVVALYSHAFLLLALLGIFLLLGLQQALAWSPQGAGRLFGWLEGALWWAMPLYLLIMQKRVYNQGWGVTVLKYGTLGTFYAILVVFAAFVAGAAGLARL